MSTTWCINSIPEWNESERLHDCALKRFVVLIA
jgi:hypothetical protein